MTKVQVNSQGKAYMTTSGKVLLSSGSSSPVISSLNVEPTTSSQTITAESGVDGYSPVNVSAVTSSIDSNITAANIKKDVTILGVTGSYEGSGGGESSQFGLTLDNFIGDTTSGVLNAPTTITNVTFTGVTDVGDYALNNVFDSRNTLTTISFPALTSASGTWAMAFGFNNCSNLTTVDLSALINASGYFALFSAFKNCSNLTNVNLSALTTVSGTNALTYIFQSCTSLTSFSFSALNSVTSNNALSRAFAGCTSLTSVSFPALTSQSFGNDYTNQFGGMLMDVDGCTVHFPSNLQSVIGSWEDVLAGFGGTNTTVLFDLTATE